MHRLICHPGSISISYSIIAHAWSDCSQLLQGLYPQDQEGKHTRMAVQLLSASLSKHLLLPKQSHLRLVGPYVQHAFAQTNFSHQILIHTCADMLKLAILSSYWDAEKNIHSQVHIDCANQMA